MKTYVINLERSPQRRQHILSQVEQHNLDFEFIKAVDGALLSDEEVARLMDAEAAAREPLKLTRGSLGCLLSHLEVYKQMIEQGVEMALVLEDDAVLPSDIKRVLEDVAANINTNEVVLLYYTSFTPCELSKRDAAEMRDGYRLMFPVKVRQPFCAAAYVITLAAAKSLLQAELPMKQQCDEWGYFYENGGIESFRCIYPVPVQVSGAKSTIERFDYSPFRVYLTKFFDNYNVPFFSAYLRTKRLSKVEENSIVKLVNELSPMSQIMQQNQPKVRASSAQTQTNKTVFAPQND